jgi:ligand-binding sensor domain-containing protein/putative methionine-R-sulfoxide reductase with GAF domain
MMKFGLKKLSIISYIRSFLLLAAFVLVRSQGMAQLPDYYHLQLFDNSYGIRPGNIERLVKDKQGFLWVLYPRSVQRFDGRETITYKPAGPFEGLSTDEAGRVWLTSLERVYVFDHQRQDFVVVPLETQDTTRRIGSVFQMPGRRTWLITSNAFFEYDAGRNIFKHILQDLPIPPTFNTRSFTNCLHTLFIGHGPYVYQYDTQSGALDSLPAMSMRRIYPVTEDSLLVSSWNLHSYWLDYGHDTIQMAVLPEELQDVYSRDLNVRSVIHVEPDRYIMAAREGLFEYNIRQKKYAQLRLFFHGTEVGMKDYANSLFLDDEGYVWMGAIEGVGRFPLYGQSFGLLRVQRKMDNLPFGVDNIRSITEDDKGNFWFATGNGFVRWDSKLKDTKIYLPEEGSTTMLAYPSIRGIGYDGKYIILGPANYGIWLFDPVREVYVRPKYRDEKTRIASDRDFVDAICKLANGDFLITGRDAIYVLRGSTYELSIVDIPAGKENSNFAFQGHQGEIWITTSLGLHLVDSNLNHLQKIDLNTESDFVLAGFIMDDGRFLFSVENGVYTATLHEGKVTIEMFSPLFEGIFVTTLVEDQEGYIWATSENGIYRYDPKASKLNLFDYSDNVQGYGFNANSWLLTREGVLFLGGTNGLNYIKPANVDSSQDSLQLFLQQVKGGANDSIDYALDSMVVLSWSNRSLAVSFVCPYFNNPDKVKYRYQLEGWDEGWKYIGNTHHLRFTSLPAGEYTLRLEATINNVDWFAASNLFSFRIRPPFWMTWWFVSLCLVAVSTSLGLFVRRRNRQMEEQQEELEAEQAINYFSTRISEDQSVEDLVWDVARNCIGRLQFEDCVIYLVDEDRNVLVQKAAHGPKSPARHQIVQPLEIRIGEGITGKVAETGVAELIHDTSLDPRYIVDDERRYSEITVPIIADGKVLGVIDCEHSRKRFFTQRHLSILTTIASLCAAKITRVRAETEKSETERILMATKQQMADIEMQALRAQMNPHFIFNCLNSINRYIVKSDQATASLYLTRFAKLIRLILDNSNSKTVTLTNELEALRLYIEMESIRFEKQFEYAITVDDEVHPDHISVPPLIIQPYVENAIWHGLLHKETAGHLHVHITRKAPSLLECIIDDDGIGRDKAKELKSKSASNSKSLGMKLTESRLALLNKHSNWDASVEIIDLKTDSGAPAGTRVILRIPVDA